MRYMVVRPGAQWSVADVARGWIGGLRTVGVEVVDHRWDKAVAFHGSREPLLPMTEVAELAADSLLAKTYTVQPDVIVVVCGHEIPPRVYEEWRRHGQRVVLVHTEAPYENDRIASMWWCADLHLANDPLGVEAINAAGGIAAYAHQAHDPAIHYDNGRHRDLPFVFVGSGFAGRQAFLERVAWPFTPILAGTWPEGTPLARFVHTDLPQPLPNTQAADLYRRARMSINLYRLDHLERPDLAVGWSMGPREVEMAACGVFFLRMPRPEGDTVLPMLPTFTSVDEASEQLAWWWKHDRKRTDAAAAAKAAVADRTFEALARGLLGALAPVAA